MSLASGKLNSNDQGSCKMSSDSTDAPALIYLPPTNTLSDVASPRIKDNKARVEAWVADTAATLLTKAATPSKQLQPQSTGTSSDESTGSEVEVENYIEIDLVSETSYGEFSPCSTSPAETGASTMGRSPGDATSQVAKDEGKRTHDHNDECSPLVDSLLKPILAKTPSKGTPEITRKVVSASLISASPMSPIGIIASSSDRTMLVASMETPPKSNTRKNLIPSGEPKSSTLQTPTHYRPTHTFLNSPGVVCYNSPSLRHRLYERNIKPGEWEGKRFGDISYVLIPVHLLHLDFTKNQ
ncbi:hypothetical protein FRC08_015720 [Ceratobasidium sp. 394]|nr:hypothetical protein FRC08_015720 [Ceratobasidium sp. 394]KAG9094407.1 hypothetical protein FS749_012535 [Ceratobasidium sp. UAMH 11750]